MGILFIAFAAFTLLIVGYAWKQLRSNWRSIQSMPEMRSENYKEILNRYFGGAMPGSRLPDYPEGTDDTISHQSGVGIATEHVHVHHGADAGGFSTSS